MCNGEDVSATTRMPDGCADARSSIVSAGPPSSSSRQLSTTVRTASMPSEVRDVAGDGIGVDEQDALPLAELERGREVRRDVVLPTPPLGLNTAMIVARRLQASASNGPPWRIGPDPSSMVWLRMHIASTRQRSDSAEYGRVKYSSSTLWPRRPVSRSSARGETTMSAGIARPPSRRRP